MKKVGVTNSHGEEFELPAYSKRLKLLPHGEAAMIEFLVTDLKPGEWIRARITPNEEAFEDHFPRIRIAKGSYTDELLRQVGQLLLMANISPQEREHLIPLGPEAKSYYYIPITPEKELIIEGSLIFFRMRVGKISVSAMIEDAKGETKKAATTTFYISLKTIEEISKLIG